MPAVFAAKGPLADLNTPITASRRSKISSISIELVDDRPKLTPLVDLEGCERHRQPEAPRPGAAGI